MAGNNAAALLAKARSAQPEDSTESFVDADTQDSNAAVRVARSGYGILPVYVLTPTGCVRRGINVQSVNEVLSRPGYAAECFDCGSTSCMYRTEIRGEISTNQCAGKPSAQYRICPERSCSKRIYDPLPTGRFLLDDFDHSDREDDGDDPNVIRDDEYAPPSPATRTKSAMDMHIIAFHPARAMDLGIGRPPEMPRLAVVS